MYDELLSIRELAKRLSMATSTIWLRIKRGELPGPTHRIGKRCSRWSWQLVLEHLRQYETAKPSEPAK
jgi:predicted DNA-binding transcriptional regulator AlpA